MRHVISREDLLDLVGEIPRPAIRRAALLGRVECLGLFDRVVEGDTRPAWMFIIKGTKKKWYVAVIMCPRNEVVFRIPKKIPWQWYGGRTGLGSGDDPIKYHMRKCFACAMKGGHKRNAKTADA